MSISRINCPSSSFSSNERLATDTCFFEKINQFAITKEFNRKVDNCIPIHKNFVLLVPVRAAFWAMLQAGASNEKMRIALKEYLCMNDLSDEGMHTSIGQWLSSLQTSDQTNKFVFQQLQLIANRDDTRLIEKVKNVLDYHYPHEYKSFSSPSEVPEWANPKTNEITKGMIPSIMKEAPSALGLFVASIGLLEGKWIKPFNQSDTENKLFYNSDGSTSSIPMMHKYEEAAQIASFASGITVLELPLKGNCAMWFIKPNFEEENPKINLSHLNAFVQEDLQSLLKDKTIFKRTTPSTIGIPRVHFEEEADMLQELQDTDFGKQLSGYNGFITYLDGSPFNIEQIKFSSKSKLEMEESGVRVADAVSMTMCDGIHTYDPPFIVNCPIAFAIIDKKSQIILALGELLTMKEYGK